MKVTVKFFAQLREQLGCSEAEVTLEAPATMGDVKTALQHSLGKREAFEQPVLMACNQQMVSESHPVSADDELAMFPPVTGG